MTTPNVRGCGWLVVFALTFTGVACAKPRPEHPGARVLVRELGAHTAAMCRCKTAECAERQRVSYRRWLDRRASTHTAVAMFEMENWGMPNFEKHRTCYNACVPMRRRATDMSRWGGPAQRRMGRAHEAMCACKTRECAQSVWNRLMAWLGRFKRSYRRVNESAEIYWRVLIKLTFSCYGDFPAN